MSGQRVNVPPRGKLPASVGTLREVRGRTAVVDLDDYPGDPLYIDKDVIAPAGYEVELCPQGFVVLATEDAPEREPGEVVAGAYSQRARANRVCRHLNLGWSPAEANTPDRGQNDERTDAIDTVANVLHYLRSIGEDEPAAMLSSAATHYYAETEGGEDE